MKSAEKGKRMKTPKVEFATGDGRTFGIDVGEILERGTIRPSNDERLILEWDGGSMSVRESGTCRAEVETENGKIHGAGLRRGLYDELFERMIRAGKKEGEKAGKKDGKRGMKYVTYYDHFVDGLADVRVHPDRKSAVEFYRREAPRYFDGLKLPRRTTPPTTCGFPHRLFGVMSIRKFRKTFPEWKEDSGGRSFRPGGAAESST